MAYRPARANIEPDPPAASQSEPTSELTSEPTTQQPSTQESQPSQQPSPTEDIPLSRSAEMGAAPTLTAREIQVLEGMSHGRSNAEIGRELFLSEDTVKTNARRLFLKLGASDRAHAVALGFRWGLVR